MHNYNLNMLQKRETVFAKFTTLHNKHTEKKKKKKENLYKWQAPGAFQLTDTTVNPQNKATR